MITTNYKITNAIFKNNKKLANDAKMIAEQNKLISDQILKLLVNQ